MTAFAMDNQPGASLIYHQLDSGLNNKTRQDH